MKNIYNIHMLACMPAYIFFSFKLFYLTKNYISVFYYYLIYIFFSYLYAHACLLVKNSE